MTSRSTPFWPANRAAMFLLPLAALVAILPLLVHGCSCGHDLVFHVQSWLDAAQQLRHGHYPHWAFSPAWNAGEPRFLFYPPLSWLLGALLLTVFPTAAAPILYIWIALTAAGFAMHHLASQFTRPGSSAALLASALYLANPYMLFNAFERSALAELLAAAWIPLLLLAILRPRPTLRGIAIPVALLWLTNAPAAVMGCYALAFLAALRLLAALFRGHEASRQPRQALRLALTTTAGAALGLALPAFYLVPAAYERRFVQVAMAVIPNMRFQDNFLFAHTSDAAHNTVNHTASLLALALILLTAAVLSALLFAENPSSSAISTEGRRPQWKDPQLDPQLAPTLAILTLVLTFLLVPLSTPIWQHLPELAFLQFPWRLLTILSAVLAFALALLMGTPRPVSRTWARATTSRVTDLATLLAPLALTLLCFHLYAQACAPTDRPSAVAQLFRTHHGAGPTDEYTPTAADNDTLRTGDPGFWLASNPQAFAPRTLPNPNATNPDYDAPFPIDQTVSARAPLHLALNLPHPEDLILNLRDYPGWLLTYRVPGQPPTHPPHLQRDDGLVAIALPAGPSIIDVHWRHTPDQTLGDALSLCALAALALTSRHA